MRKLTKALTEHFLQESIPLKHKLNAKPFLCLDDIGPWDLEIKQKPDDLAHFFPLNIFCKIFQYSYTYLCIRELQQCAICCPTWHVASIF